MCGMTGCDIGRGDFYCRRCGEMFGCVEREDECMCACRRCTCPDCGYVHSHTPDIEKGSP